jgi:uncharacterized membrane protein
MKILIEIDGIEDVVDWLVSFVNEVGPILQPMVVIVGTIMWLVVMGVLAVEGWKWWKARDQGREHG